MDEINARPLAYTLEDYRNAPGGKGPLADMWRDKPHRFVYDLAREVRRLRRIIAETDKSKENQP